MKKYLTWKVFFSRIMPLIALTTVTFFYLSNLKEREPVWNTTSRIQIYNKDFTKNSLIILNKDSTQITDDIYAQELMIWNAGKIPIEPKDVRVPIRLVFSDSVKLIEYEILEEKASNKNNFSLIQKGDSLELKWKYFDPNYGVKFRCIYSSKNKKQPNIEGAVLGNNLEKTKVSEKQFVLGIISVFFAVIFGQIFYPFFKGKLYIKEKVIQEYKKGDIFILIILILLFLLFTGLSIYFIVEIFSFKSPPF